jgi:secreted PhoX family phosphatase
MPDLALSRSQAAEEAENAGANDSSNPTMGEIIAARFSRRDLLRGALAVTAISATVSPLALASADRAQAAGNTTPSFTFKEVAARADDRHDIADGYDADILIRWGDAVLPGAPEFDPTRQTAAAQARQFGYNNDYLGYVPLDGSRRGLLVVNHEYTNEELMFPGLGRQDVRDPRVTTPRFAKMTKEVVEIEMMAHGGSVLEVARGPEGKWAVVPDSRYARRITAHTDMEITGPAGRPRADEDQGRSVRPEGPRHAQQLRRRHHAVGHLAHVRGEHQRLFLGQGRRALGRKPPQALRHPGQLV